MEKKYFPLGNTDDRLFVRIAEIVFGAACIVMAAWWLVISIKTNIGGASLYVTVAFLIAIGGYLLWAGGGKAARFVAIDPDGIIIKKNPLLPALQLSTSSLKEIEIYPLSIKFILDSGKHQILRLGTINYETNEKIIDELARFAEEANIKYEIKEDL